MKNNNETMKHLKQAQGQLNAALNMLEDGRYCIDVSHQILATIAQLKKANEELMRIHMQNCVSDAFKQGDGEEKIDEVIKIMSKLIDA